MKTDALARRLRFASPQPLDQRIEPRERDFVTFEALDRHGPLPSHYLFEFTKHECRNFAWFERRLTKLYNGSSADTPLLARPPQQFDAFAARYQHLVYDLTPRARNLLHEQGRLSRHAPKRIDPFLHRLMSACVSASIELTARASNIRYIPKEEIFAREKCPETTRRSPNPLSIPLSQFGTSTLIPDDLFGLQYPDGFQFFAVEIDRKTESIERRAIGQNSFARKIEGYFDILRNRMYRSHWGVPNLSILTVTTNAAHVYNLLAHLKKQDEPRLAERFLFKAEPHFGSHWRVPSEVLGHLLAEPWQRVGDTATLSK